MQSPACTRDGITIQRQEAFHQVLRVRGHIKQGTLSGSHSMTASAVEILRVQADTVMKSWQIKYLASL